MALIKCEECQAEISDQARRCPQCGAKVPHTKWWLWIPLALVAAFLIFAFATGPKTYAEYAQNATDRCIKYNGNGEWSASSGMSLETYCKGQTAIMIMKEGCEKFPADCRQ